MPDCGRLVLNSERGKENNSSILGICEAEGVAANGGPTWNWRETPGRGLAGGENESAYNGTVISVKWGESTKRIGICGSSQAIKDAIRCAFGLIRTKRAFRLKDDNGIIQSLDRDMPLQNYNLHLDKDWPQRFASTMNSTPGLPALKRKHSTTKIISAVLSTVVDGSVSCFKNVDTVEELHPGKMFHGLSEANLQHVFIVLVTKISGINRYAPHLALFTLMDTKDVSDLFSCGIYIVCCRFWLFENTTFWCTHWINRPNAH